MGSRFALLIGNSRYNDPAFSGLVTPPGDVESLADVLRNPRIGGFDTVSCLIDATDSGARKAIAQMFSGKMRDDLLLLYFSGHGFLDEEGQLYIALRDTEHAYPSGSAIPASFVNAEMERSAAKHQILMLDCCHSGAFAHGMKSAKSGNVGTGVVFRTADRKRAVLTATDTIQYAFEDAQTADALPQSAFTRHLVRGLETGEADEDGDGYITVAELFDYVHDRLAGSGSRQRPQKWTFHDGGRIVIGQTGEHPAPLQRVLPAVPAAATEVRPERTALLEIECSLPVTATKPASLRLTFKPGATGVRLAFQFPTPDLWVKGDNEVPGKPYTFDCHFDPGESPAARSFTVGATRIAEEAVVPVRVLLCEIGADEFYDEKSALISLSREPAFPPKSFGEAIGWAFWQASRRRHRWLVLTALLLGLGICWAVYDVVANHEKVLKAWHDWVTYKARLTEEFKTGQDLSVRWHRPQSWRREDSKTNKVPGIGMLLVQGREPGYLLPSAFGNHELTDFTVQFQLQFVQGDRAAWLLRWDPSHNRGWKFVLRRVPADAPAAGYRLDLQMWENGRLLPDRELSEDDLSPELLGERDLVHVEADVSDCQVTYHIAVIKPGPIVTHHGDSPPVAGTTHFGLCSVRGGTFGFAEDDDDNIAAIQHLAINEPLRK